MTKNYTLYNEDCLDRMKKIEDKSIDLILCDPPYGTTLCDWDKIIPFDKMWKEYNRILKDDGVICLFSSEPFSSKLLMSNPNMFREELIWLKNRAGNGLNAKQKHLKIHEKILVFSKNGKYTFNPQMWLVDKKEFMTQRKTFNEEPIVSNLYGEITRKRKPDTGERYPISIVSCRLPVTTNKTKTYSDDIEIRLHPTQKPVELLSYLIKTFSNEGGVVLDNCMGSGSTGVACVDTNRQFIGIEINENYFNIAKDRINKRLMEDKKDEKLE